MVINEQHVDILLTLAAHDNQKGPAGSRGRFRFARTSGLPATPDTDGRLLCSHAYRREPMVLRAVLSNDGGEIWDTDNTFVLRDDGGYPSQLRDDPSRVTGKSGIRCPSI